MSPEEREQLYTLRWYVREKWSNPDGQHDALEIMGKLLGDGPRPDVRPSVSQPGQKLLWCPFAQTAFTKSRTRGSYALGYPRGAIVHFTSGRRTGLKEGLEAQVRDGYTYFLIDQDGNIGQNFPLDSWGYHAGDSRFSGLSGTVSDEVVGIEVQCGGKLEANGKTWFGTTPAPGQVRYIQQQHANQEPGKYEIYTPAQEDALERLIRWLHANNPEVFSFDLVLGHDEVSPGRKNDPGGSLSMTMPEFRKRLKENFP